MARPCRQDRRLGARPARARCRERSGRRTVWPRRRKACGRRGGRLRRGRVRRHRLGQGRGRARPDPAAARVAACFAGWGIPTAQAIRGARQAAPDATIIGSGGIVDGLDAARAIRLGADVVSLAGAVLASAIDGPEALLGQLDIVLRQLRTACFCTGSADLAALRQARLRQPA
ncbi:alpha-hydroxy-acid oxidizing protein [Paracoccus aerius]